MDALSSLLDHAQRLELALAIGFLVGVETRLSAAAPVCALILFKRRNP